MYMTVVSSGYFVYFLGEMIRLVFTSWGKLENTIVYQNYTDIR